MCVHYAPGKPKQCDEDDAIEVRDKRAANFCDYFAPSPSAYATDETAAERRAHDRLAELFGDAASPPKDARDEAPSPEDLARRRAEELFKK